jgi:cytochrome P450
MTRITVSLPDDVAERAKKAGLLSDRAIRQLLEDAMRREAGRKLLEVADQLRAAEIPPMSDEEIVAEVKTVRAERRARSNRP